MPDGQPFLRPEALPLNWADLDDSQQRAVGRLILMLADALGASAHPQQELTAGARWVPWLDEDRKSRVAFLMGARGSGKTSVLLAVLKAFRRRSFTHPPLLPGAGGPPAEVEQAFRVLADRVVWLAPLDMDPLPRSAHLFSAVLARLEDAVYRQGGVERLAEGPRGLLDTERDLDLALAALHDLQTDVALSWEGDLSALAGHLDPDPIAREVMRAERARLALNERLNIVLEKLAREVFRERADRPLLFVLPVDDFDLNPARCLELLDLLRTISVPRLFFILLGDEESAELAVNLHVTGQLAEVAGPGLARDFLPIFPGELAATAASVAGNVLTKLLPPAHRIRLEAMSMPEALRFTPRPAAGPGELARPSLEELLRSCRLPLADRPESRRVTDRGIDSLHRLLTEPPLPIRPPDQEPAPGGTQQPAYQGARVLELLPRHLVDIWFALNEVRKDPDPPGRLLSELRRLYKDAVSREPALSTIRRRGLSGPLSLDPEGEWLTPLQPFLTHIRVGPPETFDTPPAPPLAISRVLRVVAHRGWAFRNVERPTGEDMPARYVSLGTTSVVLLYTDLATLADARRERNLLLRYQEFPEKPAVVEWSFEHSITLRQVWPVPPVITFWEYDLFMSGWQQAVEAAVSPGVQQPHVGLAFLWIDLGAAVLAGTRPVGLPVSLLPTQDHWNNLAAVLEQLFVRFRGIKGVAAERVRTWLTDVSRILTPRCTDAQAERAAAFREQAPELCAFWSQKLPYQMAESVTMPPDLDNEIAHQIYSYNLVEMWWQAPPEPAPAGAPPAPPAGPPADVLGAPPHVEPQVHPEPAPASPAGAAAPPEASPEEALEAPSAVEAQAPPAVPPEEEAPRTGRRGRGKRGPTAPE